MNRNNIITRNLVPDHERIKFAADMFGVNFPLRLEPYIYAVAGNLAKEYRGGYWQFYTLSNGGFYMWPDFDGQFTVSCENGFSGPMSEEALGIMACLYAFSHLSFTDNQALAELCAEQFHLLREYPPQGAMYWGGAQFTLAT